MFVSHGARPVCAGFCEPERVLGRSRRCGYDRRVSTRYRCGACGNLTRFDVLATRRTRAFHHYSIGGELTIEEEDVLEDRVEEVTCRWCGATGDAIERVPEDVRSIEESA